MTLTAPEPTDRADPGRLAADRPGWRNPRLVLGLLLVAGSVVLGARLLAAADDTVGVWAVTGPARRARRSTDGDLERRQVRFPDAETADGYLAAADDLPEARP